MLGLGVSLLVVWEQLVRSWGKPIGCLSETKLLGLVVSLLVAGEQVAMSRSKPIGCLRTSC